MSPTWDPGERPPDVRISALGWGLVAIRVPILLVVIFGGLLVLLALRLVERPLFGMERPVTPWITQTVCRITLKVMGLRLMVSGPRMIGPGAIVANHASWLDIFVLNSRKNVYFVSKAEVAVWAGIGWLARATGTVFINRDRREAQKHARIIEDRLLHGHRLLFFPEGTSTDSRRVLPFKTTLFAAFFSPRLEHELQVQPVSVIYKAPRGQDPRFYGWWGDMDFGPSLIQLLAQPRQGSVTLTYHDPVRVDAFENRKALAAALEAQVRQGFENGQKEPS
ncbi:2-acyl-glycerophospho-ethanolamine acyltransferase [Pelagimonas phthalicica]|uniref:2-acyl-glycerophospho-ethanolamine acyltransferase n=1 Tax=Pelagimonas phthalicica TaxID=1037362 RepID=A0A238JCB8_9RHOB|nr:lysophospholipid acyltransferase family protein [Pelagimonas phthalicica]TDS91191.1 lyso-ornithine lipid acyltransferase [Pelagimonas phthalicica]SMX28239.1 2-acyl-glycerophospho-ethanolamine acyltransferase [Pelagimonas phthalicica]